MNPDTVEGGGRNSNLLRSSLHADRKSGSLYDIGMELSPNLRVPCWGPRYLSLPSSNVISILHMNSSTDADIFEHMQFARLENADGTHIRSPW